MLQLHVVETIVMLQGRRLRLFEQGGRWVVGCNSDEQSNVF
jgi:hypothetical protein